MSAKLLYSLSDEKTNLQKQIGCMNGFLQFFERRHLISDCSNRRLTQAGENSHQGREANGIGKRSKEKHQKVVNEMQGNTMEASRVSVSSSTGSTLSIQEYDQTTKPEKPPFDETIFTSIHSRDSGANRTFSSPNTSHRFQMKNLVVDSLSSCASPIKTPKRQQVVGHATKPIDSPRLMQPSKFDSPRLAAQNESLHSVSSNQSALRTPLRRKEGPRMSYDGTEIREGFVSGLKVGDLPRLSLDSRQRTINKPNRNQNLAEEPGSYRSPSSVVAKLMGLEAVSDCSSGSQSQICGRLDSLSRSSRTIDNSKLNRALDSPRSKYKDLRTPQLDNAGLVSESKQQNGHHDVDSEPGNHFVTVYGEIEKRLADIDFKKSGKDLRALKQILEAMHREKKAMSESRNEIQCLSSASQNSSGNSTCVSQKQGPRNENRLHLHVTSTIPHKSEGAKPPEDMKSPRSLKQDKLVNSSKNAAGHLSVRNVPSQRIHGIRVGQPMNTSRGSAENRTAKDAIPKPNRCQYTAAASLKPLKTSKVPRHMAEVNVTNSARISESVSTKAMGSRTKHNQPTMSSHSQNRKLSHVSIEFNTESTCRKRQGDARSRLPNSNSCFSRIDTVFASIDQSPVKHDSLQQVSDTKLPEGTPSDGSSAELTISLREQPSPVSVLDSAFYGDESPSPVKKRPTTFQGFYADYESPEASNETEGKDTDLRCSPYSRGTSFSHGTTHQQQENFKQSAQIPSELNSDDSKSITRPLHKEANLEKAYVAEILLASGFINNLNFINLSCHGHQLKEAINPKLFFILEQTTASRFLSDSKPNRAANTRTHDKHQRKLMFDAVNEIMSQKLAVTGFGSHLQPISRRSTGLKTGQQLLQEICKEINQLQLNSSNQSLDDEDDFLTTIIEKDLTHRSGNWTDISSETSSLVLDIERLVFKDLIVELIHDETSHAQAENQQHSSNLSK